MSDGPQIGVTLYSFTEPYHSGEYTFEELIRRVGDLGLGPGLEIVGFQSIRDYPTVSDSFALRFRRLVDEAGLVPSALGANIDIGRRADRPMSHEETVETLELQIRAAAKLGFKVLRVQFGAAPDALEAALPLAEASDVKLGMEIHAPHSVDHPTIVSLRERFDWLGSPYLGFIPDFGASAEAIPAGLLALWRGLPGANPEVVEMTVAAWERAHRGESDPFEERRVLIEAAAELDPGPGRDFVVLAMTLFGHQSPAAWDEIMPQVVHVHAKFYEIDAAGDEPSIRYEDLMPRFRAGFDGYLSSEWEGSLFAPEVDPFDIVRRQQQMMRRYLGVG